MTDDRKRAEDVYDLVKDLGERIDQMAELRERVGGDVEIMARIVEHEQLMVTVPVIEGTLDALADEVIGPKIPDPLRPGEYLINGKGQPMRKRKRRWPLWVGQAAIQAMAILAAALVLVSQGLG